MKITPLNTDIEGNCSCLKANYYKMGGGKFYWSYKGWI